MKNSAYILYPLLILFFVAGCSLFRTQPSGTLFTFELDGKTYEIAGYVSEEGESANYLTHRDDEQVVLRALDRNRSGVIDQVISGSLSVLEANKIYQTGIQIAMESDLYKTIERNRTFELEYGEYQLMVESYKKGNGQFHNRFILYDSNWDLMGIYWDDNSDGRIDRTDAGELDMDTVREMYSVAIERAGEQSRLLRTDDGQIVIRENDKRQRNLAGVYD